MKSFIIVLFALALFGCDSKHEKIRASDAEFGTSLIGVWSYATTNSYGVSFVGEVTYRTNGSALWRGNLIEKSGIRREFDDTGVWRIKDGFLFTRVTNSVFRLLANEPEYRDELILVTPLELTYRDGHDGREYTRNRK